MRITNNGRHNATLNLIIRELILQRKKTIIVYNPLNNSFEGKQDRKTFLELADNITPSSIRAFVLNTNDTPNDDSTHSGMQRISFGVHKGKYKLQYWTLEVPGICSVKVGD
ncbi:hypothetical protein B5X24_HaOG201723 [Helicoverpa armigera]|nr:hypothetical protein B5X24_HaOG201723 [Helicoverpa armigera]